MIKFLILFIYSMHLALQPGCQSSSAGNEGFHLELKTYLNNRVSETSGLAWINQQLWTHNDSHGGALLFQIDPNTGVIIKQLKIQNAINRDWEDITYDDQYLYIADTGNNDNKRSRAQIYVVHLDSLRTTKSFTYATQVIDFDFGKKKAPNCEAVVATGNRILLFTKGSGKNSKIYSLDKEKAVQQAEEIGKVYSFGKITGASKGEGPDQILLTGYQKISEKIYRPFVWKFDCSNPIPEKWKTELFYLDIGAQIEGIDRFQDDTYYLGAEKSGVFPPRLFTMDFQ